MLVLGVASLDQDSAVALVDDQSILGAIEEEKVDRAPGVNTVPGAALQRILDHLLQMIALLQRRRFGEARDILCDWVPLPRIPHAMPAARELALAMTARKLIVPPRHGRTMAVTPVMHEGSALWH